MRDGEVVKAGDGLLSCANTLFVIKRGAPCVGWVAKSGGSIFIRRIRKARPHRFDGMTLAKVMQELTNEWLRSSDNGWKAEWLAPRFAREVRRRDKMRDGK